MDHKRSSPHNLCPVCNCPAQNTCSGCFSISYCSPGHQKDHWKSHSVDCKPFTITSNEKYGRYVVATKDIEPGTIVMNEPVLVYGPKRTAKPLCLGCHRLLAEVQKTDRHVHKCSKCLFPLCGPDCEKIPIHAENECRIFEDYKLSFPKITDFKSHHPIYECILPLRCLLLKKSSPKKWKKITAMMHHNESRQKVSDVWYRNHVNIVQFLLDHCQMGLEVTELEIHTVIGYIDVNAFEIIVNENGVAALFHNIYIMSHECVSNTHHTFNPTDFRMIVRASVPIKQGDQITSLYANILEGTMDRIQFLRESKYFDCTCPRCAHPSELGTYFSAIKCQRKDCSNGFLLPKNSLDLISSWTCSVCTSSVPVETIHKILEPIKEELRKRERNYNHKDVIKKLEQALKKYSVVLHPNHYLLIQVAYTLIGFYGKGGRKLKLEELKRKEMLCEYFLKILDVFSPGISRLRGTTMFELQETIFLQVQKQIETNSNHKNDQQKRLQQILKVLEDAYKILSFDPAVTPEGQMATQIPKITEHVKGLLQQVLEK